MSILNTLFTPRSRRKGKVCVHLTIRPNLLYWMCLIFLDLSFFIWNVFFYGILEIWICNGVFLINFCYCLVKSVLIYQLNSNYSNGAISWLTINLSKLYVVLLNLGNSYIQKWYVKLWSIPNDKSITEGHSLLPCL